MRTPVTLLLALAALAAAGAGPACAARADRGCEPETTGALPPDPRSLLLPGERPAGAEAAQPEESWQEEFSEDSEQRRRDLLACGVD